LRCPHICEFQSTLDSRIELGGAPERNHEQKRGDRNAISILSWTNARQTRAARCVAYRRRPARRVRVGNLAASHSPLCDRRCHCLTFSAHAGPLTRQLSFGESPCAEHCYRRPCWHPCGCHECQFLFEDGMVSRQRHPCCCNQHRRILHHWPSRQIHRKRGQYSSDCSLCCRSVIRILLGMSEWSLITCFRRHGHVCGAGWSHSCPLSAESRLLNRFSHALGHIRRLSRHLLCRCPRSNEQSALLRNNANCQYVDASSVPLRARLLVKENLRFPSSIATCVVLRNSSPLIHHLIFLLLCSYAIIVSMIASRQGPLDARIKWLSVFAAIASIFTLLAFFFPVIANPPLVESLGSAGAAVASFGWTLTIDPMFMGAGMMSGTKTGVPSPLSRTNDVIQNVSLNF
jgi:hypothetical protein